MERRQGGGRGARRLPQAPPQDESPPPSVPEPVAGPSAASIQQVQVTLTGMSVSAPTPAASADRGGRCRGRGRGRGRDSRVMDDFTEQEQGQTSTADYRALAKQFEDDPVVTPPPQGSPPRAMEESLVVHQGSPKGQLDDSVLTAQVPPGRLNESVLGIQGTPVVRRDQSVIAEEGSPPSETAAPSVRPQAAASEFAPDTERKPVASQSKDNSTSMAKKVEPEPVKIVKMGTEGKPVTLKCNYLRLALTKNKVGVVEYHVSFDKDLDSKKKRREILDQIEELGTVRSFDGQMLFLPYILPNDVTVLQGKDPLVGEGDDAVVNATISFVKVKELHDRSCIQFINILFNRIMRVMEYVELRREFYDVRPDSITCYKQHKLEVWPGKNVTTSYQEDGLMVCVSTCNRVLRTETVFEYYKTLKGLPNAKVRFEEFIINKIILTSYNNKCYKVDEVEWDQNPATTFLYRGEEMSYAGYLKKQYGVIVKEMDQPMLISRLKPRKNELAKQLEGQSERMAALVPEICRITGLTDDQRKDFKIMTDLATSTRLTPTQRVNNLNRFTEEIKEHDVAKHMLGDWGLELRDMIDVKARKLDGPTLTFSNRMKSEKTGPDFSRESTRAVFEPIPVRKYLIVSTQRDADKAVRFMEVYNQVAGPLGIKMLSSGDLVQTRGQNVADFDRVLKANCDPQKVQFVVIIMPGQKEDLYRAIKTHCVATKPIPSQCIVSKTLGNEKRLRSIVLKIALQINCKLGGALWSMTLPTKKRVMFVGVDSAHDPLKKAQSVICLVASMNNECTKYFSKSSTAATHQELGSGIHVMMREALQKYREINQQLPDHIIVFRDGGSEGALPAMEDAEGKQLKLAAKVGDQTVKLTYVIVNKRISQRFFLEEGRQLVNPHPGTVVDNAVTRLEQYDFYVISQKVGQGTVNPTHFTVLDPSDPIPPDRIQQFAYITCFMYFNWSGTVRVPAMVQYAHKLAALLSKSVNGPPHRDISTTLYYL